MDRGPAGSIAPGVRASRRLLATGLALAAVLAVAVAVLATWLGSPPAAPRGPAPPPPPAGTASPTVPGIYQRLAPSVVIVRTSHDLGTGVIVADNGTILTANHVIAGGGAVTVTFADGTTANAAVAATDPKLDIATLTPAKLPQVVVPATLGGGTSVGASVVAIGNPLGLAGR